MGTTPGNALSEEWLARTDQVFDFYKPLHDRYAPDAPIWVTETADAACGGNPWGATFLDSFRYVDQMGRLAKRGVQAIFHNTLASSEYGLLDQRNFKPRPNYWAALLWRRLMGPVVLDAGQPHEGLHLYAQCLRGQAGGVALVAINNSRTDTTALSLPKASRRYTLTAMPLQSGIVRLNGPELRFRIKRRQAHLGAILILLVVFTAADATSSREHSVLKYGKSSLPLNEWSSFPKDCSSLAWKIG